jgi:hypothetical protein
MNRIFLLVIFVGIFLAVPLNIQNYNHANAAPTLDNNIQQFNKNLQSSINKEVQSNINSGIQSSSNNNINNCDNGNNISIQSQTNTNGKTTSTSKYSCNTTSSPVSSFGNVNLKGTILSSEYKMNTGTIVNSLFGNWSLTTDEIGINDFKSSFIKQPLFYLSTNNTTNNAITTAGNNTLTNSATNGMNPSSSSSLNSNNQTAPTTKVNQNSNNISYALSNFRANSVNQQNSDITYVGLVDVVKNVRSLDPKIADETNNFKDMHVSISILNDRTLVINFDKQSVLFDEFKDIPLVGLVQ